MDRSTPSLLRSPGSANTVNTPCGPPEEDFRIGVIAGVAGGATAWPSDPYPVIPRANRGGFINPAKDLFGGRIRPLELTGKRAAGGSIGIEEEELPNTCLPAEPGAQASSEGDV